ncbi:Bug family tripartite tricarboxylate transporter substrate binding protein [Variovorax ureilyticus]|uniref:Bug family tripartite tricarboxylate transporter substrate binding protein n=1 Tax=Variovorax ureilyticus TaxID=1836198 RepID=UPI003D6732A9
MKLKSLYKKMGFAALLAVSQIAGAQDYPNRPITMVIGFGAGGPTDVVGRFVARQLEAELKQPVIVDNRAGANGLVALQYVKRAKPDGYTILMGSSGSLAIEPAFKKKVEFDVLKDFIPIAPLANYPYVLVVSQDSPYKTLKELVDAARTSKVPLSFASAGIGADNHLAGEWFAVANKIKLLHVPYKGDPPAMQDVATRRVDFAFLSGSVAVPQVKAGKLRALAVADDHRAEFLPDVPTVAESLGTSNFVVGPWNGLLVPAGTDPAIVTKLSKVVNKIMASPETRAALLEQGQYPSTGTSQEFARSIDQKQKHWAAIVEEANLEKVD